MKSNLLTKVMPVVLAGGGYRDKVLGTAPIAYWPLWEAAGAVAEDLSGNGFDGDYVGVTLGQDGIGDGNTCPLFDGANDYVDVFSTGLRDALNETEGSMMLWMKVFNAGVWEDGEVRRGIILQVEGGNYISIAKWSANNTIRTNYRAGVTSSLEDVQGLSTTDWMNVALTWSATSDEVKTYYNGAQDGVTLDTLGTWVGVIANARIGALNDTPTQATNGWIAHCAIWDSVLTAAAIAELAAV